MKLFNSKRNTVYLSGGMVFKRLKNRKTAEAEGEFLIYLKQNGVAVPDVLSVDGDLLCLEYIKGAPLPDFLSITQTENRIKEVSFQIADWLGSFYKATNSKTTNEIRGDVNGRNFIVTETGIFGVDFEAHVFGSREVDFGKLLAYISTYTYKDSNAQRSLERYLRTDFLNLLSADETSMLAEYENELVEIKNRRRNK